MMTPVRGGRDTHELLLFAVGEQLCGLDVRQVQELDRSPRVTPVYHAPEYVRGVLNLRGQLLTVIDLRARFSMEPAATTAPTGVVVVKGEKGIAALLVDRIEDIVQADSSRLEPPPANVDAASGVFFTAVYKTESGLAAILDLEQVLSR